MNRIVLIGNGFDLAHGLKTKYEHFIKWYLNQNKDTSGILYKERIRNYDIYIAHMNSRQVEESMRDPCSFLNNILKRVGSNGWVDIEKEYYALLIQQIYPNNDSLQRLNPMILNIQLDHLKSLLIDYLKVEGKKEVEVIQSIKDKIYRPIKSREIAVANLNYSGNRESKDFSPNNIMLLNFNYTKTARRYVNSDSKIQINHVHGCLDDAKNVIFGYGDELDRDFEKLKNLNDNECLRNMKSIRYLEADNYRNMLAFIDSAPFQVCIMGHSCGMSDRTLLNTIFEHKNCISIKPYYYEKEGGTDNYLELVQNIYRSFTDMRLMRDRVVNKKFCEPLV
ncbi:MAG: hypothetical protein IJV19_00805 [Prevotella sp.]|nr:hypothetical protein [Prevotella sp.]